MIEIVKAINYLEAYLEKEAYKGFDPYDTLLSRIPFQKFGKWGPIIAIQFQKRNPINIRPLLGIKKEYNPKAMGLLLHAYSILYHKTRSKEYRKKSEFFFSWLQENYTKGYSGYCWGYNFPWASPVKYMEPYVPSAVVTGFVCRGMWAYFLATGSVEAIDIIKSAGNFVRNDLHEYLDQSGKSISYTPLMQDVCYNASLLAGEILAMGLAIEENEVDRNTCIQLVNFVVHRQKKSGAWNYSEDLSTGAERRQIDFHQGYILESIHNIKNLIKYSCEQWEEALETGLYFYNKNQFYPEGRSLWRLPKEYPVEIHNQSQGIIIFSSLRSYRNSNTPFAEIIAQWTIKNMQSRKGHFYYHKNRYIDHKISYMRWSQAWMFLALSTLYINSLKSK